MKLKYCFSALLILAALGTYAQNYKATYQSLIKEDKPDSTIAFIRQWQKAEPDNAEVYVAYVNVYAREGFKEVLSLSTKQPDGKSLELKDKKNKVVGYLGGTSGFNEAYLEKALTYFDTAITRFPNRLDIRFGKTYVLGRIKNYKAFTDELVSTIEYGHKINYNWLWANNNAKPDGKIFMLSTVQDYVVQLHQGGIENMDHIAGIAIAILKNDPDNVPNLSNLAISHLIKKEYSLALTPLLKAEKLNPKDVIVLNNIAYCYSLMGNKPEAIKYYHRVLAMGNDEQKATAQEHLVELQKK